MLMNPVKHAVLDAVRSFRGLITACSNAFLIPFHGVTSPCSSLWDRGKGLLLALAPRGRCYTESHHRHYQELARLRHARAAGLVVDNRELRRRFDQYRFDTLDFSDNQYPIDVDALVSVYMRRDRIHKRVRERQAQYWNHEMVNEA